MAGRSDLSLTRAKTRGNNQLCFGKRVLAGRMAREAVEAPQEHLQKGCAAIALEKPFFQRQLLGRQFVVQIFLWFGLPQTTFQHNSQLENAS